MKHTPTLPRALLALGLLAAAGGCDDGTRPASPGSISFSVVSGPGGGLTASAGPRRSEVLSDGTHTLELTRVALVIRKVELEGSDGPRSTSPLASDGEHEEGLEELEFGPLLVEVPLDGEVDRVFSAVLPEGSYKEVELEIHKPSSGDASDQAFLQAHPEFAGVSIRVEGTFDGAEFVFTQNLDAEQEYGLDPPLVVGPDAEPVNLTLRVDLSTWFARADGSLVDPRTAGPGGASYEVVKENIKRSFHAFEDDDCDGEHDRD